MAGYLIALLAFFVPLALSLSRPGRTVGILGLGAVLGLAWIVGAVAGRTNQIDGKQVAPLWFIAGLAVFLFAIWCGGVVVGARLRRLRTT